MLRASLTRRSLLAAALTGAGAVLLSACGGQVPPAPTQAPPGPTAVPPANAGGNPAPAKPADTSKPAAAEATKPAATAATQAQPGTQAAPSGAAAATQPAAAGAATAAPQTNAAAGVSGGTPTAPTPTIPAGAKVVTFWIPWG